MSAALISSFQVFGGLTPAASKAFALYQINDLLAAL